jgi:RNA polymerase sigma-70 factor (ECF subfamily)
MTAVKLFNAYSIVAAKPKPWKAEEATPLTNDIAEMTRAMVRGDQGAWVLFHEGYSNRLHRYLLVVARGDEQGAEEMLQLTLTRVARHIRQFNAEEVFWSWLTTLARSAAVDEIRKRVRRDGFFRRLREEAMPLATPSADGANELLRAALEESLALLAEGERRVLERKYLEGASVREIAAESATTEKAIESRLGRARRTLKENILALLKNEAERGKR